LTHANIWEREEQEIAPIEIPATSWWATAQHNLYENNKKYKAHHQLLKPEIKNRGYGQLGKEGGKKGVKKKIKKRNRIVRTVGGREGWWGRQGSRQIAQAGEQVFGVSGQKKVKGAP